MNKFIGFGTKIYLDEVKKVSSFNPVDKVNYIMNQVNTAEYYNLIPFEYWNDFCDYFNSTVLNVPINKELHYFRLKLNRAPNTLDDLLKEKENWTLLVVKDSIFHMYNTEACTDEKGVEKGEFNLKFVSKDGKFEAVYNYNNMLLDDRESNEAEGHLYDPKNMGTYNYANPDWPSKIIHGFYDVMPFSDDWYGMGYYNLPGEYVDAAGAYDNSERYDVNDDAKDKREFIKAKMEGKD